MLHYCHLCPLHNGNALQDAIDSFVYVAVTLFFLFSSYGMLYSAKRKQDYLKYFWRNRLIALLVPCFLINIVSVLVKLSKEVDITYLNGLYEINNYVLVLLQYCFWFYIVQICKKKWFPNNICLSDGLLIGGVMISSLLLYFCVDAEVSAQAGWNFERMGLIWGILLYRFFDKVVVCMNSHRWLNVTILTILGGVLGIAYLKYKIVFWGGEYLLKVILGLVLILLLFTWSSNRKFGNKVSLWLG